MLLARLGEHEMTLPEDVVHNLVSDHLDTTARLMRIGRQAAKFYVTDDVITGLADQILGIDQAESRATGRRVACRGPPEEEPLNERPLWRGSGVWTKGAFPWVYGLSRRVYHRPVEPMSPRTGSCLAVRVGTRIQRGCPQRVSRQVSGIVGPVITRDNAENPR